MVNMIIVSSVALTQKRGVYMKGHLTSWSQKGALSLMAKSTTLFLSHPQKI